MQRLSQSKNIIEGLCSAMYLEWNFGMYRLYILMGKDRLCVCVMLVVVKCSEMKKVMR